ncbi:baseplate J/gp47 family protein [Paracoccus sp. PAR01]|uniref:baseplate assembly protein n=1 Tax=Paracoccus sp. PAR01 TaxID=2769282 RepID=UPI0017827DEF|nr:baseplate J/gp47 family protein [Paracoccus sp. PAR01]MBD9528652.1 baseplate J/gp47 family protein [Paracoccus sp. PAR01]
MADPIDLAGLSAPDAVEDLDFELILSEIRAQLLALAPELADVLELESEPINKLLEVGAYREVIMRARANDSVRAVLLATATGTDLENLAALYGVTRQVVVAANPDATPPVAEIREDDAALRKRTQLSLEALTTAGTVGAYSFHALSADGRVRGVAVTSPAPGRVLITVLSHEAGGMPSAGLLAVVADALEDVRPLCDDPVVAAPSFTDFAVDATLVLSHGPGAEVVQAAARAAVQAYVADELAVGRVVRLTALLARLHQPGVESVVLTSPTSDINPGRTGVARASSIAIGHEVMS